MMSFRAMCCCVWRSFFHHCHLFAIPYLLLGSVAFLILHSEDRNMGMAYALAFHRPFVSGKKITQNKTKTLVNMHCTQLEMIVWAMHYKQFTGNTKAKIIKTRKMKTNGTYLVAIHIQKGWMIDIISIMGSSCSKSGGR